MVGNNVLEILAEEGGQTLTEEIIKIYYQILKSKRKDAMLDCLMEASTKCFQTHLAVLLKLQSR